MCKELESGILIFIPEVIAPFRDIFSIFIHTDKSTSFYSFGTELPKADFSSFFKKRYFVTSLEDLRRLLEFISLTHGNFIADDQDEKSPFEALRNSYNCKHIIDFFEQQVLLSEKDPNGRRFTPELIIFSFMVFSKSRSAYLTLSEVFILPAERTLRTYGSGIGSSLCSFDKNLEYFSKQCQSLAPHQRDISVKYDEIQIKSKLEFRSGRVYGYAENREGEVATHLQCFMIRSIKSKYREMVTLIPVHKQNATFLKKNLLETVDLLVKAGFANHGYHFRQCCSQSQCDQILDE